MPSPADPAPVHGRILVIDDNRDAADSFAVLLRLWGFETTVAYTATQGLEAARANRPDCVLSDIGLPDFSGYDLAAQFARDDSLRTVPLIAITANGDEARARAAGFLEHFVKPADLVAVESLLTKLLIMDKRLERAEELVEKQVEVISETRDLMTEVRADVNEIKQELQQVKDDVKVVQEELDQIKQDLNEQDGASS